MHTGGQVEPSAQLKAVPIVCKPFHAARGGLFCRWAGVQLIEHSFE